MNPAACAPSAPPEPPTCPEQRPVVCPAYAPPVVATQEELDNLLAAARQAGWADGWSARADLERAAAAPVVVCPPAAAEPPPPVVAAAPAKPKPAAGKPKRQGHGLPWSSKAAQVPRGCGW